MTENQSYLPWHCSVWLPPLSRLLPKCKAMEWIKGFSYKTFVRIECFISVHILTLSLCTFINGQSTQCVRLGHTSFICI